MAADEIHPALERARQGRLSKNPVEAAPPYALWTLASSRGRVRGELYRHALTEAGHIVDTQTGRPLDPCPYCGWRAQDGA